MSGALTFRLLGHRIAYSASPAMMAAAFGAFDLPHQYVIADITADEVPQTVASLRGPESGGANVTVPHKAAVAALCDEISDVAREAEAVNTVVREGDRLIGHNTDMPATVEALERLCPSGVGYALILGAGGVSRAVQLALRKVGVERITVLRRSDGTIASLAEMIGEADLVVNATPVGTGAEESLVPAQLLRADLAVLDLVYRPSPTRLVREARSIGAPAEAGAGILLGQAWRSLELWLRRPAPIEAMRRALEAELGGTWGA